MEKEKSTVKIDTDVNDIRRVFKNVVVLSIAFMLQFTAYNGAVNLQSSINAKAGLGTASLAAVYSGFIFSSLFLPVAFIKWLGTKWTITLSFIVYMPYIAAQCVPSFYTLIPTGLLVGLAGGPVWCAKCTYLSVISEANSKIFKIFAEALLTRFMGLFFMIFSLNQLWGNLISSLVISTGDNAAAVTSLNVSQILEQCGANFLPAADGKVLTPQPPEKIQMIAGIYLACMAGAALIIAIGVDSTKRYESDRKSATNMSVLGLLASTLKLLRESKLQLLIFISAFIGYQEAFFTAELTSAFVSCAVGTGSVGFVMMSFGIASAIGCVVTGYLAKLTGRLPLMCVAALVYVSLFVTVLIWRPHPDSSYIMYIMAVPWGVCNSVCLVIVSAFFGILYPGREEAAFAACHLWKAFGYIIVYIISPHLSISYKTYLMIAMLVVGVTGYLVVEIGVRKSKKALDIAKEVTLKNIEENLSNEVCSKD